MPRTNVLCLRFGADVLVPEMKRPLSLLRMRLARSISSSAGRGADYAVRELG